MRYLVDTDRAVWWLRGTPAFVAQLRALRRHGLAVSAITLAELVTGIHRSANPSQSERVLVRFLRIVSGLAFTDEIAHRFGRENAQLLSVGQAISQFDLAIAATALHYDLVLLTENRRHYERIPGLKLQSIKTL